MSLSFLVPSAAAIQTAVDAQMSLLSSLLPATSAMTVPTDTEGLQPLALLPNLGGASSLLILRHETLDPKLATWLGDVRDRFSKISNLEQRADAVFSHVRQTFSPTRNRLLHPIAWYKERQWAKEPMVALGARLAWGIGSCIPQSAALQLAFQETSVPSNVIMGNISETCLDKRIVGELVGSGPHAWVEATINGGYFLYDTTQEKHFSLDDRRPSRTRSLQISRGLEGKILLEYRPASESRIIGVQIPLSQDYLKREETAIRGALALYARSI